jgi:hypothetical protein
MEKIHIICLHEEENEIIANTDCSLKMMKETN